MAGSYQIIAPEALKVAGLGGVLLFSPWYLSEWLGISVAVDCAAMRNEG